MTKCYKSVFIHTLQITLSVTELLLKLRARYLKDKLINIKDILFCNHQIISVDKKFPKVTKISNKLKSHHLQPNSLSVFSCTVTYPLIIAS